MEGVPQWAQACPPTSRRRPLQPGCLLGAPSTGPAPRLPCLAHPATRHRPPLQCSWTCCRASPPQRRCAWRRARRTLRALTCCCCRCGGGLWWGLGACTAEPAELCAEEGAAGAPSLRLTACVPPPLLPPPLTPGLAAHPSLVRAAVCAHRAALAVHRGGQLRGRGGPAHAAAHAGGGGPRGRPARRVCQQRGRRHLLMAGVHGSGAAAPHLHRAASTVCSCVLSVMLP